MTGDFGETAQSPARSSHGRGLTAGQKILILGLVATTGLLVYVLLGYKREAPAKARARPMSRSHLLKQQQPARQDPNKDYAVEQNFEERRSGRRFASQSETARPADESVSLKTAEEFYSIKDYDRAYVSYSRLRQNLLAPKDELLKDYLQMRMALCMEASAELDGAGYLFAMVSESRSPLLRASADYHLCLLEMQAGHYLKARSRAYRAIALTGALTFDFQWALELERDCHFLAAEALTREILSLTDRDKELPERLWRHRLAAEPLSALTETELRGVLDDGRRKLSEGVLGPQIVPLERQAGHVRFSLVCQGPSIEELLSKLAANAGLDVQWANPDGMSNIASRPQKELFRRRVVSLYMPAATARQAATTAAGAVGLLAEFDDEGNITISNPEMYPSLSEHLESLAAPAISLWQQLLLTYYDDVRLPNAHFALGLLHGQKDRPTEAIAEYKLVANRFTQSPLAPYALMQSSVLKAGIRDYTGSRQDLKQLIEQYPDSEISGLAHLRLAETTAKAKLYEQAANLYRKVYNLALSPQSQTVAALGAGRSFYEVGDYASAAKWLVRYIDIVEVKKGVQYSKKDYAAAYFLLGQANLALGNLQQACIAYRKTLSSEISKEQYVQTVAALVEAQSRQEKFVDALKTIENMYPWPFSQAESTKILLLKSRILQAMGLLDEAVTILMDRTQYLTDEQLKAQISFELARCYRAEGKPQLARTRLVELLTIVEPGPMANEVSLELADAELELGQTGRTIALCSQLLEGRISASTRQSATELLAEAYNRQKNYDKAALALLGK